MSDPDLAEVRVAITRPTQRSEPLVARLESLGAVVESIPLISIGLPDDEGEAFREAWSQRDDYDWIAFTSASSIPIVSQALGAAPLLPSTNIAAVGPATARALEGISLSVALTGDGSGGRSLAELIGRRASSPGSLLVINAQEGRNDLAETLSEMGWDVRVVAGYATRAQGISPFERQALLDSDVVVVASPSAARSYAEVVGSSHASEAPQRIVAIGATTGDAAIQQGFGHVIVASTPDDDGLVEAVARAAFEQR